MLRRILATATTAGLLAGLAVSLLQEGTTTPLIMQAERFEAPAAGAAGPAVRASPASIAWAHDGGTRPQGPAAGAGRQRLLYTAAANVLTAIGFALVLAACFAFSGRSLDGRAGLLWGGAGFVAVSLAPALGLPPELPGTAKADLGARQAWWLLCVLCTAAGLWAITFRRGVAWVLGGMLLVALPHLAGAPRPEQLGGPVPPELAAQFAASSLVVAAAFWCVLGWTSGALWSRFQGGPRRRSVRA